MSDETEAGYYRTAIEQLDQKMGRPVTIDDWHRIGSKPGAALTDDDLVVCGYFGGPSAAAAARARREKALAPPPPPDPPVKTKTAVASRHPVEFPARIWDHKAADVVKAMEEWAHTHAMCR